MGIRQGGVKDSINQFDHTEGQGWFEQSGGLDLLLNFLCSCVERIHSQKPSEKKCATRIYKRGEKQKTQHMLLQ